MSLYGNTVCDAWCMVQDTFSIYKHIIYYSYININYGMTFWYFILSCASFSFDSLMARTGLCDFDCFICSWLCFYQTSAFLCVWGSNGSVILLSKHADLVFSSLVKMNHFVSCLIFMSEAAYGIRLICYKRIFDADLCFVFIQLITRSMKSLSLFA